MKVTNTTSPPGHRIVNDWAVKNTPLLVRYHHENGTASKGRSRHETRYTAYVYALRSPSPQNELKHAEKGGTNVSRATT